MEQADSSMKYSIVLSTTGTRSTLQSCADNFWYFTRTRRDIELIIGTNNPNLKFRMTPPYCKLVYRPEHRVMWADAIDASTGEFIANVDDDIKLSKNYFADADRIFTMDDPAMIQPTLLDAEGYVCLRRHYRTYTISLFQRTLLSELGMDYDGRGSRWDQNNITFVEAAWREQSVIIGRSMYAVHYGYPIKGGVDSTISPYGNHLDFLKAWRQENNYERIPLEAILPSSFEGM